MRRSAAAALLVASAASAVLLAVRFGPIEIGTGGVLRTLFGGGTPEERRTAVQLLDRAARKGLIHRNKAARHKSVLAKQAS